VDLPFMAEVADAFYIGGTKQGALFGEAMVILNDELKKDFRYVIKQKGGMLAKGRLLGLQFETLFRDGLYTRAAENAICAADRLRTHLKEKGYQFFFETPTNQIFIVMENEALARLGEKVVYSFWEKDDDTHTVIRLATSWATTEENLEKLLQLL
jgi:threonine aldolase